MTLGKISEIEFIDSTGKITHQNTKSSSNNVNLSEKSVYHTTMPILRPGLTRFPNRRFIQDDTKVYPIRSRALLIQTPNRLIEALEE